MPPLLCWWYAMLNSPKSDDHPPLHFPPPGTPSPYLAPYPIPLIAGSGCVVGVKERGHGGSGHGHYLVGVRPEEE